MNFIRVFYSSPDLIICGIDSSERSPGICFMDCSGVVLYSERIKLTSSTVSRRQRANLWFDRCLELMKLYKPDVVCYEEVNVANNGISGVRSTSRSHGSFYAAINVYLKEEKVDKNILYIPVNVGVVKGWATGDGKAEKDLVVDCINDRFELELKSDDIADAIACASLGCSILKVSKSYISDGFSSKSVKAFLDLLKLDPRFNFLETTIMSLSCLEDTEHAVYRKTKAALKKM